jgi:hypothetical protein
LCSPSLHQSLFSLLRSWLFFLSVDVCPISSKLQLSHDDTETYFSSSIIDNTSTNLGGSLLRKIVRFDSNYRGLNRYFFRRYVRTLLVIFLPAALLITPVLLPLNYTHGKTSAHGVSGLDTLGWSNVGLGHYDRYWAHLALSLIFILHICWVIWTEFTCYIEIRQKSSYAALRTVLIDSIPKAWMTEEALASQLQLFPGKIIAISFNRDFRPLSRSVIRRDSLLRSLEVAETRHMRRTLHGGIRKQNSKLKVRSDYIRPPLQSRRFRDVFLWPRSQKVEATLFYHKEVQRVSKEIQIGQETPDKYPQLPSAFVTE